MCRACVFTMRLTEMLLPSLMMVVLLETSVHAKKKKCLRVKIENGRTYIRNGGMKAKFKCMKGYSMSGTKSVVCLPSGTWSSPPPLCIRETQPTRATTVEPVIKQMTRKPMIAEAVTSFVTEREPSRTIRKKCPKIKIKNGRMKIRNHGNMAKFSCKRGYTIVGDSSAMCLQPGSWNHPPPICISRGCTTLGFRPNIEITESYNGAMLRFSCPAGTKRKGPETITCDGKNWSDRIPTCEAGLTLECDFEKGLCGWNQDVFDDFDWTRKSGGTQTKNTGPLGDHTTGGGFYMFIESSSPRKVNDVARLTSPVYPPSLKDSCFDFWYHMQGPANKSDFGSLEIFIKPDKASLVNIDPEFSIDGNQGTEWKRGVIQIPNQDRNFKIVIVGTRKHAFNSDIAIDDVRLFNCSEDTASIMILTSTPTPMITKSTDTESVNFRTMETEVQVTTEVNTDGQMDSVTTQESGAYSADIASTSEVATPPSTTESTPVTVTSRRRGSTVTRLVHRTTTTIKPIITISKSTITNQKTGIAKAIVTAGAGLPSVTASILITDGPLQVTQNARTLPPTVNNEVTANQDTSLHQEPTTEEEQPQGTMSNRINEIPASPAGNITPDSSTTELSNIVPIIISNAGDTEQNTESSSASITPIVVGISVAVVVQVVVIGILVWLWANRQRKKREMEAAVDEMCMQLPV